MCFLALNALHGRSTAGMNPATRENVTGVSDNPWDDVRVEVDRRLDLVLQVCPQRPDESFQVPDHAFNTAVAIGVSDSRVVERSRRPLSRRR
jgi:hypothetical protein